LQLLHTYECFISKYRHNRNTRLFTKIQTIHCITRKVILHSPFISKFFWTEV